MKKRALIAMSGGVDSSVAALLMKEKGYDCIGVTMKLYDNDEIGIAQEKTCCTLSDVEDAKAVCAKIDIPHYVFNFKDSFKEKVIDKFVQSYKGGCTPNPCIDCNRYLKFAGLYQRAKELECDVIVTGHYVRVVQEGEKFHLMKGLDHSKDQSYVLYNLTSEQLAHTEFPLGAMEKSQVRQIAEENGLINARKKESQDICFIPDGNYRNFIEKTGEIKSERMIFPRYHQLDVVTKLLADVKANGAGKNYLIQHSAGSGKSNSIAWLAHRLSGLHDANDEKRMDFIKQLKVCHSFSQMDQRGITDVWEVVQNMELLFDVPGGVYNFGSPNNKSMYDTVVEIFEGKGYDTSQVRKLENASFRNLTMSQEKLNRYGIKFTDTVEAVLRVWQ